MVNKHLLSIGHRRWYQSRLGLVPLALCLDSSSFVTFFSLKFKTSAAVKKGAGSSRQYVISCPNSEHVSCVCMSVNHGERSGEL